MPAVAWFTLSVVTLIIVAAALGLLRVIFHLKVIRQTLGTVVIGVRVVEQQTTPVGPTVASVNANLKPVRDFAATL